LIAQLPYLQTKLKETPPQHLNINDGYLADSTKKKKKKTKNLCSMIKLFGEDKTCVLSFLPIGWLKGNAF